jgi:hypothetical protein
MKRDPFFVVALSVAAVAAVVVWILYLAKAPFVQPIAQHLTTFQQGQLDLFQQRTSALLTVCTLIIGGAGGLLVHLSENSNAKRLQQRLAMTAIVLAGFSMFNGYLAYDAAIWMLENRFFNLESGAIHWCSQLQLWSSVVALCLVVGSFVYVPVTTLP